MNVRSAKWRLALVGLVSASLLAGCSDYGGVNATDDQLALSNMTTLLVALRAYSAVHAGEKVKESLIPVAWPSSLDQIVEDVGGAEEFEKLMTNPLTGDNPGYEYEPPPQVETTEVPGQGPAIEKLSFQGFPPETVVLYQLRDGERDLTLPVGFVDGTIMLLETRLKQLDIQNRVKESEAKYKKPGAKVPAKVPAKPAPKK